MRVARVRSMDGLIEGIDRAVTALKAGLSGGVAAPEPWEEVIQVLEGALEHAKAGDRRVALQQADVANGQLKVLAMVGRGTFETMNMEGARREALQPLDYLPRSF